MTWVEEHLGLRLRTGTRTAGVGLEDVVGLALRRNPRRAHLLVSRLLAKHIPADPRLVHAGGRLLGGLVHDVLHDRTPDATRHGALLLAAVGGFDTAAQALRDAVLAEQDAPAEQDAGADDAAVTPLVLGYAETATALGHCVADALPGSTYLHSTRRPVAGVAVAAAFEEPHSHATSHLLLPRDPALLRSRRPLVLVDDELSTGATAMGTIRALQAMSPRDRYVVAALVDLRADDARAAMVDAVAAIGARLDVVSLVSGAVDLPAGVLAAGARLVEQLDSSAMAGGDARAGSQVAAATLSRVDAGWPADMVEGGRHGFGPADRRRWREELAAVARRLDTGPQDARPTSGERVLFLGTEELMAAPLRLAEAYADAHPDVVVRFSTTTRSPAVALDDVGYALRSALSFPAHDEPMDATPGAPGARFAYNVGAGFDRVVLVTDGPADTPALMAPGGLVDQLRQVTARVQVVVLPVVVPPAAGTATPPAPLAARPQWLPAPLHGPQFGSYAADEVSWLLTDLSHVHLEAPTQDREAAIQSGRAHYAESLPVEYQPDAAYQSLFHTAVEESARRIAHAVGVVAEILRAERGGSMVLASLARAGTPIGILVRRWVAHHHGVAPPHYTLSIVRGRGIDTVALEYLASRHDPRDVVFVDGWTGKGAIARELTAAVDTHNASHSTAFDPDMAVLADPGRCVRVFGTRDDFLIPSACLNSTVSGLVSRTVLNDALIGPGDFHGAKFYAELAGGDVSNLYLDAVTAHFDGVRADVARDWPIVAAADRTPTWEGWAAVERIAREYGIGEVNLVKPGVGETTRVLLRRVPQRVLVRADAAATLPHVLLLARQRGVPVELVHGLPYTCVGLIEPHTGGEG